MQGYFKDMGNFESVAEAMRWLRQRHPKDSLAEIKKYYRIKKVARYEIWRKRR